MRQKTRIWASEESESRVLMGRVSQYLERRDIQVAIPGEREDPASLTVRVPGRAQRLEQDRVVRGWERPPGAPGHRCWTSASSTSCSVPVRDHVYMGTWAFFLYLETRAKRRQCRGPHNDGPG